MQLARKTFPLAAQIAAQSGAQIGAKIAARWGAGDHAEGVSMLALPVPKGSVVHVEASLAGYEPMAQDVAVDSSKPLSMLLRKIAVKKKDLPKPDVEQVKPEDVIPLEDFGK